MLMMLMQLAMKLMPEYIWVLLDIYLAPYVTLQVIVCILYASGFRLYAICGHPPTAAGAVIAAPP